MSIHACDTSMFDITSDDFGLILFHSEILLFISRVAVLVLHYNTSKWKSRTWRHRLYVVAVGRQHLCGPLCLGGLLLGHLWCWVCSGLSFWSEGDSLCYQMIFLLSVVLMYALVEYWTKTTVFMTPLGCL